MTVETRKIHRDVLSDLAELLKRWGPDGVVEAIERRINGIFRKMQDTNRQLHSSRHQPCVVKLLWDKLHELDDDLEHQREVLELVHTIQRTMYEIRNR
jgi:hypothetical protein